MTPLNRTKLWVQDVVIGLDLCPWAKPIWEDGSLHFSATQAASPESARVEFFTELERLLESPARASTLLVFEKWLIPFVLFWDVVGEFEAELDNLNLSSQFQLVAFHPNFIFGGVPADSMAHWVNRSPYPTLHFLRSDAVARATQQNPPLAESLSRRNEGKLKKLTPEQRRKYFGR